jgi:hypothetical protein
MIDRALSRGLRPLPRVRLVTAEDVAANRFTLEDVVLPLLGTDIALPGHALAQRYVQIKQ